MKRCRNSRFVDTKGVVSLIVRKTYFKAYMVSQYRHSDSGSLIARAARLDTVSVRGSPSGAFYAEIFGDEREGMDSMMAKVIGKIKNMFK